MHCPSDLQDKAAPLVRPTSPLHHRLHRLAAADDTLSTSQGSESGADDKLEILSKALKDMQNKYHAQERELKATREKLRAFEAAQSDEVHGDGEPGHCDDDAKPEEDEPKWSSARQSLRRLCTKRANGTLKVPADVFTQYWNGGGERDKLLKLYVKSGCSKPDFLKEVQVISEKEKSMNMEVAGDFHDETTMREKMKLSE